MHFTMITDTRPDNKGRQGFWLEWMADSVNCHVCGSDRGCADWTPGEQNIRLHAQRYFTQTAALEQNLKTRGHTVEVIKHA